MIGDKTFDAMKLVRQACDMVEDELQRVPPRTREYAKLDLARHRLIDAVTLVMSGEVSPDTMIWGWGCIDEILKRAPSENTLSCMDCGVPYADIPLDATLSDEQWRMIHDSEGGILCASCMVARAAKFPGAVAVRMRIEFNEQATEEETT